ncbi:MAG TPA: hotdog domain-containing protein [Candidatus Saccharimonadales bacterium]|jgi:fluoroacetyl-CoA thioesterase|nr:hotdog domain-containing protein [Candidatus Saccharimonadales bacterium]
MNKGAKIAIDLAIGLEGRFERVVLQEWTLAHMDPNWPAVFTTPAMIGMMEMASSYAVRSALPPGSITVGVRIEVDHLKPVPVGATVTVVSRLAEIDGRRLIFEAEARSGEIVIGRGRIFHAIVEHTRFLKGAKKKHPSH